MTQTLTPAYREEMIPTTGGLQVFIRSWRPARPTAAVTIVHGFNSHSGHYPWAAERLVEEGFAVYAVDLRGRGRSEGERFYIEHFSDYLDDVTSLVTLVKSREPQLPVFLLGHSAGGVISCNYVLEHPDVFAGFICESFAFQVYAPDIALTVVKGLSHVAPHVHVLKLKNEDFSRDPAVVRAMDDDPLLAGEVQPTLTVAEMARADERLNRDFEDVRLPVLILHGTADKVTRPGGSQQFYDRAGSPDKTLTLYEGHAHDLLNDFDRERVIKDIVSWIRARH